MKAASLTLLAVLASVSIRGQSQKATPPLDAARLPAMLRYLAKYNGSRFLTPGKERTIYVGTISRGDNAPVEVRIIRELPKGIRIEERGRATIGISQAAPWKGEGSLSDGDSALLETLLLDSMEGFLAGQSAGLSTRLLGSRFRADDGTQKLYTGPYHDIYQVFTEVQTEKGPILRSKRYAINSESQLMERVQYSAIRGGASVHVETRITSQKANETEWVPSRIQTYENGRLAFTLILPTATFSAHASDGLLERP